MSKRGVSEEESLRRYRPIPRQKLLGSFVDYFVQLPRRPNEEQISVVGVKSFYDAFAAAYQSVTCTRFDRADSVRVQGVRTSKTQGDDSNRRLTKSVITQYIREGLPQKFGVRRDAKPKYEITETDLDALTATLWCSNDCFFKHERMRVQLTLYLLLHAYSGARAGTFIEHGNSKGSGRCLKYKVSISHDLLTYAER